MLAVIKGSSEMVQQLLDAGADVHVADKAGMTARKWAKKLKRKELARLLKEAEMDGQ